MSRSVRLLFLTYVFLIRVPLLMPFWLIYNIGRVAERVGSAISRRLPGL